MLIIVYESDFSFLNHYIDQMQNSISNNHVFNGSEDLLNQFGFEQTARHYATMQNFSLEDYTRLLPGIVVL